MVIWFVYMVLCSDNSIYTGITTSPKRREKEHNAKRGAKSLLGKLPVNLVFVEKHIDQKSAAKREKEIKGWNHEKKLSLIKGFPREKSEGSIREQPEGFSPREIGEIHPRTTRGVYPEERSDEGV